tara:strand:+ start:428 stop:1315 length:888 start_codon:yes stop_codon:yes gene_type:complete
MTTKSEIIYKSKTKNLRSLFDKKGNELPIYNDILDKFTTDERAYYAGMIDGDGCISYAKRKNRPGKRLKIVLELKEVNAEPLAELANIFDLSVRRKIYYDTNTNTKPSLMCEFGKAKAEIFLVMIYPHLLEKKMLVKNILTDLKYPAEYLTNDKQFSYAYLAGYTDAEGCITFKLRHQKGWKGKGITSNYNCSYRLTSNNFGHLAYLKNQLEEKGYKFNKDQVLNYKNVKEREGRNPDKWKSTKVLIIGGWEQLSSLYKSLLKYSKINNKRQLMKRTQQYHNLIYTALPRYHAKK